MSHKTFVCLIALAAMIVLPGCVSIRSHIEERERVDQDIAGMPPAPKKTRQIVVIEVTEKDKAQPKAAADVTKAAVAAPVESSASEPAPAAASGPAPEAPKETAPAVALPAEYKVEKDDTLQKIAKKFYGAHNQWPRVYNANRDVLKNPNFVKPGIMLKIPALTDVTPAAKESEENKK
ncbi:MAG: LysM peptidoglycan-binding domain-containing protein [Candidatus Omnitrophica bacterium]|nr:LysM peptidoglycan-binding domain-containing protein [Candidatus Omnitrophota bacterium]